MTRLTRAVMFHPMLRAVCLLPLITGVQEQLRGADDQLTLQQQQEDAEGIFAAILALQKAWSDYDVFVTIEETHTTLDSIPISLGTSKQRLKVLNGGSAFLVARTYETERFVDEAGERSVHPKESIGVFSAILDQDRNIAGRRDFPNVATQGLGPNVTGLLFDAGIIDLSEVGFVSQPCYITQEKMNRESVARLKGIYGESEVQQQKNGDLLVTARWNPRDFIAPDGQKLVISGSVEWVIDPMLWLPKSSRTIEYWEFEKQGLEIRPRKLEKYTWKRIGEVYYPETILSQQPAMASVDGKVVRSITTFDVHFKWLATNNEVKMDPDQLKTLLQSEKEALAFLQEGIDR